MPFSVSNYDISITEVLVLPSVFRLLLVSIINGEPLAGAKVKKVAQNELDFVASIAYRDKSDSRKDSHFCSGALISSRHVLTNEHCILSKNVAKVVIYLGSPDVRSAKEYFPAKWTSFGSWYYKKYNDIIPNLDISDAAIITLRKAVNPEKIKPARISYEPLEKLEGSQVIIAGWGTLMDSSKSTYLKKAIVNVESNAVCSKVASLMSVVKEKFLCTSAKPVVFTKSGDRGGPVLDAALNVIAITSGNHFPKDKDPHSAVNVHVNVLYYKDFITDCLKHLV
ncbi:hypothetical protein QAD02_006202 [Eretmocerus hayati]|uniref:Uncharacterized protein n=1 Tax=Eretmocerus hayati TaxID=131215 RepID=A0ACC2N0C5_9HYME|nr:hypothetical protein QAD02_006202 [Eretmocerus hayati]